MTITEITWGDPIDAANDGKPLPWLKADERVKCYWGSAGYDEGMETWAYCAYGWTEGFQIKLPADHPYYLATSRGFTYWPGGDSAPDDCDNGEVLFRDCFTGGEHPARYYNWRHRMIDADIIGYRKRAEVVEDNDDYVRVKRMTLAEYQRDDHGSCAWARRVGIIREETPLEQFERDHGKLSENQRNCIEEFIMWQDQSNHG